MERISCGKLLGFTNLPLQHGDTSFQPSGEPASTKAEIKTGLNCSQHFLFNYTHTPHTFFINFSFFFFLPLGIRKETPF
jgi:hypothetical protein